MHSFSNFCVIDDAGASWGLLNERQIQKERKAHLDNVTEQILNYTSSGFGVTLFGPQVTLNNLQLISKTAETENLSCLDHQQIILLPEHIEVLHYECNNPIPEDVLNELYGKELLVCYWKLRENKHRHSIEEILNEFVNKLTKPVQSPDNTKTIDPILQAYDVKIKRPKEELERDSIELDSEPKIELDYIPSEINYMIEEEIEEEDNEGYMMSEQSLVIRKSSSYLYMVTIPPVWTPENSKTTGAAIYTFFRNQTLSFLPPDPTPDPPHLLAIFDSWKRRDVTDVMNKYSKEIITYGYFTTDDPETAERVAATTKVYNRISTNRYDKLIVKVAKRTSHAILALASHGPTYISPNTDIGKADALMFFPTNYINDDDEDFAPLEVPQAELIPETTEKDDSEKSAIQTDDAPVEDVPPPEDTPPIDSVPPPDSVAPPEIVPPAENVPLVEGIPATEQIPAAGNVSPSPDDAISAPQDNLPDRPSKAIRSSKASRSSKIRVSEGGNGNSSKGVRSSKVSRSSTAVPTNDPHPPAVESIAEN